MSDADDDDLIARVAYMRLELTERPAADNGHQWAVLLSAMGAPLSFCCIGTGHTTGGHIGAGGILTGASYHFRSHASGEEAWACAEARWPGLQRALLRRQTRDQARTAAR